MIGWLLENSISLQASKKILVFFQSHPEWAFLVSIGLNVLVALAGLLPSIFITAANVVFFGTVKGFFISLLGEVGGAYVSFLAYRGVFRPSLQSKLTQYPLTAALTNTRGRRAASIVFSLRLMPLVPSGIITFAAATGRISLYWFLLGSALGKIPALVLETALVAGFLQASWQWQVVFSLLSVLVGGFIFFRLKPQSIK